VIGRASQTQLWIDEARRLRAILEEVDGYTSVAGVAAESDSIAQRRRSEATPSGGAASHPGVDG